mmetsp:Transcript_46046/g.82898  ORF Transcript_46046/g.82898 Transcript_46046/m.82898 type:complete len:476 (+) Transcript_46046:57-1484(+)
MADAIDERSALLGKSSRYDGGYLSLVQLARLITFASSFSEGWDISIFAMIIMPVRAEFGLTGMELGLLASLPAACAALGILGMGCLADMFGRKPALLISYTLCCIGCMVMATSPGVLMLGFGRCISSIGVKSGVFCNSVYMSEISPAGCRGSLVTVEEIYLNLGILAGTFAAWFMMDFEMVTWRHYVSVGIIAPAASFALVLLVQLPESPRFLQMWGRSAEATAILRRALDDEDEIERTLEAWKSQHEQNMTSKTQREHVNDLLELTRDKGFMLATYCWIARGCSGMSVIGTYFTLFLVGWSHGTALKVYTAAMIVKMISIVPSVLWLIDHFGRRPLFLISALGCSACMATAAVLQFMKFPVHMIAICLVAYFMAFSFGYGPVVWVYCFEILPNEKRGRASMISSFPGDLLAGLAVTFAPRMQEANAAMPFTVVAVMNVAGFAIFYWFCPETKGMLLEVAHSEVSKGSACSKGSA